MVSNQPGFLFATGIENSIPTIDGGRVRMDEMDKCGHYRQWGRDFDLVQEIGIRFLRYGPPPHTTLLAAGRHDWSFADAVFPDLRRRGLVPIVDLCHFGLPDFLGNFQNPDFPAIFADYARAFAQRYPWIQLYTPVNEMSICALFSALYGWWNEQMRSDRAFVTALEHVVKANLLAMRAILEVRPDALFVQSESTEYFHARSPAAIGPAETMNARRFLSLDLNYGRRVDSTMYEYPMDNGMTRDEYHFFLNNNLKHHCIMGNDYYQTSEHHVAADGSTVSSGEIFGYAVITHQYYNRYRLPVMHTEINLCQGPCGDEAVKWLRKEWANVLRVRNNGVPLIGFTWYSLIDQVDWDTGLRGNKGHVNALGLADLERRLRPVGQAYRDLIDVGVEQQVGTAVERVMGRFGRLDVVVNNTGLMVFKLIAELDAADWTKVLQVDLLGAFFFIKQAFLHMGQGGAIVNVASVHALETEVNVAPYAAAKAALLSLTRSAALEGAPWGIRVNAVLPGAVDTPMLWNNPQVASGAEHIDAAEVGKPADIAAAIAFLASGDAAFVQGASLLVDGGRLCRL